jgi:hypothetical protein
VVTREGKAKQSKQRRKNNVKDLSFLKHDDPRVKNDRIKYLTTSGEQRNEGRIRFNPCSRGSLAEISLATAFVESKLVKKKGKP